ncbi:hypothetical protein [Halosimplex litoreum]|uniref:hypothetical protein n=1 Tax=Halosimplex litoreum TaxID=1198301 RepID=UPI00374349F5
MPEDSAAATGPIDATVLQRIGRRLSASERFEDTQERPSAAPNAVVADYDSGYFPAAIDRAYLRIRWFETDDFSIHYSEQYQDGSKWECRWDRHPDDHNTRAHFHPPPDADTPGENVSYEADWRAVLTHILDDLDERVQAFWE